MFSSSERGRARGRERESQGLDGDVALWCARCSDGLIRTDLNGDVVLDLLLEALADDLQGGKYLIIQPLIQTLVQLSV
jgi:hypothetical protein